jgi:hypothetical protein
MTSQSTKLPLGSTADHQGTLQAHDLAIYLEPMRTTEISAAGQTTCELRLPWLRTPCTRPGLQANRQVIRPEPCENLS